MSRRLIWGVCLAGAVGIFWAGCGSDGGSQSSGAGGAGASASAGPGPGAGGSGSVSTGPGSSGAAGGGATPVFETDIVPIIMKSCGATDNSCHSRVAYAATKNQNCRGWLSLEDEALGSQIYGGPNDGQPTGCPDMPLYERLTQLDAWQCTGSLFKYVAPCKPDESYIIHKIGGGPYCEKAPGVPSDPMPLNKKLDPGELETWTAWIAAGAPRANGDKFDCGGGTGGAGGSGAGGGGSGKAPSVMINHPGDMETRFESKGAFPFIGAATDPEDGQLTGASLVWTSDQIGQFGTGTNFNFLPPVGTHVITLTATDSDKNTATASITIIMQP